MGIVDVESLHSIVETVRGFLERSEEVEVGCIGGHGRTGAALAAVLMREEGLSCGEAIDAVRARYCNHAIETPSQGLLLCDYGRYIENLPLTE